MSVAAANYMPLIDTRQVTSARIYSEGAHVAFPFFLQPGSVQSVEVLPSAVPQTILVTAGSRSTPRDYRYIAPSAGEAAKLLVLAGPAFFRPSGGSAEPTEMARRRSATRRVETATVRFLARDISWKPQITAIVRASAPLDSADLEDREAEDGDRSSSRPREIRALSEDLLADLPSQLQIELQVRGTIRNGGVPLTVGEVSLVSGGVNQPSFEQAAAAPVMMGGGPGRKARVLPMASQRAEYKQSAPSEEEDAEGAGPGMSSGSDTQDYVVYPLGAGVVTDRMVVTLRTFSVAPVHKIYVADTQDGASRVSFGYRFKTTEYLPACHVYAYSAESEPSSLESQSDDGDQGEELMVVGSSRTPEQQPGDVVDFLVGTSTRVRVETTVEEKPEYELDRPSPRRDAEEDYRGAAYELNNRRVVSVTSTISSTLTNRLPEPALVVLRHHVGNAKINEMSCRYTRRRHGSLEFVLVVPAHQKRSFRCRLNVAQLSASGM